MSHESTLVGNLLALVYLANEESLVNDENASPVADPWESRAIDAVRRGDPNAYDYLVTKYMKRVLSIAWGIVRDTAAAEDLAQDAFVKAYEKIGRFREGEPFGPWIYRIVTNLALDFVKHRRKFPSTPVEDHEGDTALMREAEEWTGTMQRIDAAIESLPEMQRIVARLSLVEEFEHAEIAAMTGLSEGTVRSHLSLARKKLQETLKDLYGEAR
jgi:RNA polymerase sigma-70 factor, ECF subfamily